MFFSPDGRNITVDLPESDNTDDRDVLVLAIDGSRETRAVVSPGNDVVIGWTPDGHSLLFASDRSGAMGLWSLPIVDGKPVGVPTIVKADIGNVVPLGVTRSGTLYWSTVVWDLDVELLPLDLATGRQTGSSSKPIQRFTGTNSQPAWSANGKWLAYRSARGSSLATGAGLGPLATAVIGIRSTETGEVRELRPALSYFRNLTWAPDGRSLVVFGTDFRGRDGVFRIDVRTSVVTPIIVPMSKSDELDYGTFSWSPDGSRLYYHKRNGSVYEHNLATGNERVIIDQPNAGRREGRLGPVRVSPDGRWIVSATLDGASAVVVLIPVEGGQARPLLRLSQGEGIHNNIPWTPDGRAVLVVKTSTPLGNPEDNQLELWHVPIDGSTPRRLDVELRGVMFGGSGRIQVSPDGRQLAVVSGRYPASEVWTLENFIPTRTTAPSVRSSTEPRNHESPCFVFSRFRACIHRAPAYGNAIAV